MSRDVDRRRGWMGADQGDDDDDDVDRIYRCPQTTQNPLNENPLNLDPLIKGKTL